MINQDSPAGFGLGLPPRRAGIATRVDRGRASTMHSHGEF